MDQTFFDLHSSYAIQEAIDSTTEHHDIRSPLRKQPDMKHNGQSIQEERRRPPRPKDPRFFYSRPGDNNLRSYIYPRSAIS